MPNFTPEQIEQFLEQFFDVVGRRQYVGARYVPLFGRKDESSIEWDNTKPYEPLTIVLYQGNSYTSRTYVSAGIAITDTTYWANTGNYNAQVEAYRQETALLAETVTTIGQEVDMLQDIIPSDAFSAENTVKDYIDNEIESINDIIPSDAFTAENTVKDYIDTEIGKLKDSVIVDTYADMYETTADNVVVLHNDSPYGDGGVCFFEKTTFSNGTSARADGTYMTPIPQQNNTRSGNAPMDSIIRCAETYIGNDNLVYGNSNTLFNDTVTNEIDCSTFVKALIEGITYENSRYVRGSNSNNIIGDYIGETVTTIQGVPRIYTWLMARYFLERKCFYKFTGDAENDITKIKAGDILFSSSRTFTSQNRLYDIDHCMLVLDVFPDDGTILIIEGGGAPSTLTEMQSTVCKIALVDFFNCDTPDDFSVPSYIGFARISYGAGSLSSNTEIVQNFDSNGLVPVAGETVAVVLGSLKTKQALQPLTAYTIEVEGILPKFDIDGCWLVLSIIPSDAQFYNVARWYHITLSGNVARMTFVTPDFGDNTITYLEVRVITETKTEYATAYKLTKLSIYRGYSCSEASAYALTYDRTNLSQNVTIGNGMFSINDDGSLNASIKATYIGATTTTAADIILGSIGGCPYASNYNYARVYGLIGRTTICVFTFDADGTVRMTVPDGIANGQNIYLHASGIPREIS